MNPVDQKYRTVKSFSPFIICHEEKMPEQLFVMGVSDNMPEIRREGDKSKPVDLALESYVRLRSIPKELRQKVREALGLKKEA